MVEQPTGPWTDRQATWIDRQHGGFWDAETSQDRCTCRIPIAPIPLQKHLLWGRCGEALLQALPAGEGAKTPKRSKLFGSKENILNARFCWQLLYVTYVHVPDSRLIELYALNILLAMHDNCQNQKIHIT